MLAIRIVPESHCRTVLSRIGECIYCGSLTQLSDEHIVPFGLGGNLVLEDASCPDCARVTSAFESRVLQGFMRDGRVVGNYPTRHRKRRPTTLSIGRKSFTDDIDVVELTPNDHPGLLFLPTLRTARVFGGDVPDFGVTVDGFESIALGVNPILVAKRLCTNTLQIETDYDVSAFARMLAKIAYGYAIGAHGLLLRDRVPILPLILGKSDDASIWLGSAAFTLDVERRCPLHALAICEMHSNDGQDRGLVARIKLFAPSGATGYQVLVQAAPAPAPK